MRDIPIIFSAPMVQALLAGRKTQTRRILKPQPKPFPADDAGAMCDIGLIHIEGDRLPRITTGRVVTTQEVRYAVGDRLWVRENFARVPSTAYRPSVGVQQTINPSNRDEAAIYAAGWDRSIPSWKPSIHMPRWASRLTLIIEGVKVQRLHDISEEDAWAEGIERLPDTLNLDGSRGGPNKATILLGDCHFNAPAARGVFERLWTHLHGPDAWGANPFVVAITFSVHRANIDALPVPMPAAAE